MLENDRKILIGLDTGHVLKKPITEEELRNYKEHPDAYFGVVRRSGRKISDPYDFFEWLVENYSETPRDRLLELCKGCDDFDALAKLDQRDLVLAVCERWTVSAIAQRKRESQRSKMKPVGIDPGAEGRSKSGRLCNPKTTHLKSVRHGRMLGLTQSTSRLTTIEGSSLPSMPARTLRAVEIAMRIAASLLSPALCGERTTLSSASSGWSSGGGSWSNTSGPTR
jgi:hypothetical protein